VTRMPAARATLTVPRLVVPAYFRPDVRPDDWAMLAKHPSQVRLVILNLANGPGTQPDPAFFSALDRLGEAGVAVAGYADTNYGRRPAYEALADLGHFLHWYNVSGVFFDRVAVTAEHLGYYAALSRQARDMGARMVVFNHGAHPLEAYTEHANLLGTFEGPWRAYLQLAVPRWTRSRPADKFYHVVYSVPPEHHDHAFLLATRRRAGCVYITDRGGANPYDGLPAAGIEPVSPWLRSLCLLQAETEISMTGNTHRSRRKLVALISRPVTIVVIAAILVLGTAAGITAKLTTRGNSQCQSSFVPAFFYAAGIWAQASHSKPAPSVMILDITGVGAGTSPLPHFQAVVRQAKAAGVTILGYSSTGYGQRPAAQVEADVRNYKAWYGVTDIFLDEVRGIGSQLSYYRSLANYIHSLNQGSSVWINPGIYPDQRYMSVGNVVMAFEGPYSSYHSIKVPGWAYDYSPSRFANTIYATSGSQVNNALSLSRQRNAGYVYVTNGSGANPYAGLPSYWSAEDSAISEDCPNSAALSVSRVSP
jgi:hypothetical protein